MSLEISGLCEALAAEVEGTVVGPVSGVYSHVGSQVEVQGKSFAASLERALQLYFVTNIFWITI